MQNKLILSILGAVCFMIPCITRAQSSDHYPFERKYIIGETYRYRLTVRQWQNEKWKSTTVSVCELTVVRDSADIPYDEIRWVSKKTLTLKDTLDETEDAATTRPYRISLDRRGRLPLPKIEKPDMTEPITDFNTFWVAISPKLEVEKLHKKGDSIRQQNPVRGDFANGKTILTGEDWLTTEVRMTGETPQDVYLLTTFMPPGEQRMHYLLPEMSEPVVKDTLNNIQMVLSAGKDHVHIQYGREYFYINSTVHKADGKLLQASMHNDLNLHLKYNCDTALSHCQGDMPFRIVRDLELELLK